MKSGKVSFELIVSIVMVALNGRFLDRAVHALDLTVCPRMLDLGQAMFDAVLAADIEHVRHVSSCRTISVARREGKLDAIVGEHRVDFGRERPRSKLRGRLRRKVRPVFLTNCTKANLLVRSMAT